MYPSPKQSCPGQKENKKQKQMPKKNNPPGIGSDKTKTKHRGLNKPRAGAEKQNKKQMPRKTKLTPLFKCITLKKGAEHTQIHRFF